MTNTSNSNALDEIYEPGQIVLSDLVNRVLDTGVVISSAITISIADIDLIQLDLRLLISSVAALEQRNARPDSDADVSVRADTDA